jgi:hypothetical protein
MGKAMKSTDSRFRRANINLARNDGFQVFHRADGNLSLMALGVEEDRGNFKN